MSRLTCLTVLTVLILGDSHLAAIRMLFDYLVTGGVLPMNPASSVRGRKYKIKLGKTPVLSAADARTLLDSIIPKDEESNPLPNPPLIALRDRAFIAVMVFSFARVSAVVSMRVEDYVQAGKRWKLRFMEKGGKYNEVYAHHNAEQGCWGSTERKVALRIAFRNLHYAACLKTVSQPTLRLKRGQCVFRLSIGK